MEKYYFGERKNKTFYFLIIYDICNDKSRNKFAKLLEGYGKRVQFSAFEFWLSYVQYWKLMKEIDRFKFENQDSVRLYLLRTDSVNTIYGQVTEIRDSVFSDVYFA